MSRMLAYVLNVLVGFSHLFNAFMGGLPKHSFSARVGKAEYEGKRWARVVASVIDGLAFDHDHCEEQARDEGLI
jgi:hypothetical protein